MRKETRGWLAVALALACAATCMAEDDLTDSASAAPPEAVKVPVWRKGKVQQPNSRVKSAKTSKVKTAQYAPSSSDEPATSPQPEPDMTAGSSNCTMGAPSCNTPAPCCDTPCAPSCNLGGNGGTGGCGGQGFFGCNSGCNSGCPTCGDNCCCGRSLWQHRSGVFGEYLYLRPTGVDMAYAFQQNAPTGPAGAVGVVHPDYSSGFRLGGSLALDCTSSIVASFSSFDSPSASSLTAPTGVGPGANVASLVLNPGTDTAGTTATSIASTYGINFKMATIDYRHLLIGSDCFAVNYSVGVAYGHLGQNFQSVGSFAPPLGTIQNTTAIHYDGGGLRYGLDFQRALGRHGLSIYGKSFVDILFGQFDASYQQVDVTTTAIQAASTYRSDRVLPILETELGLAWTSCGGHIRISGGYYNSFWFNAITTGQYIQAVQSTSGPTNLPPTQAVPASIPGVSGYNNLGQTIAFDGLVARLEVRY